MKKLLYILLLLTYTPSLAQKGVVGFLPTDSTTQKISYQGVVEVPGATKEELYSRAREWFALSFKSGKDVLDMDDKADGKLIGRAFSVYSEVVLTTTFKHRLWRTIKVYLKDGKYRYELTDWAIENTQYPTANPQAAEKTIGVASTQMLSKDKNGQPKGRYKALIEHVQDAATLQIASMQQAMSKNASKGKDW